MDKQLCTDENSSGRAPQRNKEAAKTQTCTKTGRLCRQSQQAIHLHHPVPKPSTPLFQGGPLARPPSVREGQQEILEALITTADTCSFHCQGPPPQPQAFTVGRQLAEVPGVYTAATHPNATPQRCRTTTKKGATTSCCPRAEPPRPLRLRTLTPTPQLLPPPAPQTWAPLLLCVPTCRARRRESAPWSPLPHRSTGGRRIQQPSPPWTPVALVDTGLSSCRATEPPLLCPPGSWHQHSAHSWRPHTGLWVKVPPHQSWSVRSGGGGFSLKRTDIDTSRQETRAIKEA